MLFPSLPALFRTYFGTVSFLLLPTIVLFAAASPSVADELKTDAVLDLWPSNSPGDSAEYVAKLGPEVVRPPQEGSTKPVIRITNVSQPKLYVYKPKEKPLSDTAVLVCPGGGYNILAWDLEGTEVARWLNSLGITAVVLKYRVPRRPDQAPFVAPLQDAQRALRLVRSQASEWGLQIEHLGILGFSAGGNLAAMASTRHATNAYEPIDAADKLSARPDFAVLVYPAYLAQDDALSADLTLDKTTPPCFFVHAGNDRISPENSVQMYLGLRKVKVPAALHIYPTGGHGFGLRPTKEPISRWPDRCADWLVRSGFLPDSSTE